MSDAPDRHILIPGAAQGVPFTGERLTGDLSGDIVFEHWHRYLYAAQFCVDRDVLDFASGEGYGSALLAQTARSVVGMDCSSEALERAENGFARPNLTFVAATAPTILAADASFDVVVSMETLEHFLEHEEFVAEIKRVLRPGGLLLMSSPNAPVYSGRFQPINPFHKRELFRSELEALVRHEFRHIALLGQANVAGNFLTRIDRPAEGSLVFNQNEGPRFALFANALRSTYFIIAASDEEVPPLPTSLLNAEQYTAAKQMEIDAIRAERDAARIEIARLEAVLQAQPH